MGRGVCKESGAREVKAERMQMQAAGMRVELARQVQGPRASARAVMRVETG